MAGTGMSTAQCADTCWENPREPPPALGSRGGASAPLLLLSAGSLRGTAGQQECVEQFLVQLS